MVLNKVQRRLRHVCAIEVRNVKAMVSQSLTPPLGAYFILQHRYTLTAQPQASKAIYTSECVPFHKDMAWRYFDSSQFSDTSRLCSQEFTVRVFISDSHQVSEVLLTENIHLLQLVFYGQEVYRDSSNYAENTIILGLRHGYFGLPHCLLSPPPDLTTTEPSISGYHMRDMYNTSILKRLRIVDRAIQQTRQSVGRVKQGIEADFSSQEHREKLVKEEELAAANVDSLRDELSRREERICEYQQELVGLKERRKEAEERNRITADELFESMETLSDHKKLYIHHREKFVKENAQLVIRRKQLVSELVLIFPVSRLNNGDHLICGVRLPNSEDFQAGDEVMISVSLGYVCHLVLMISQLLNIPLRYPIIFKGSRSSITDHINSKLQDNDRNFPLFSKGQEKLQFDYGVYLLNKNIAQLSIYCGLPTKDLRATLPNLKTLLELKLGVTFEPHRPLHPPPSSSDVSPRHSQASSRSSSPAITAPPGNHQAHISTAGVSLTSSSSSPHGPSTPLTGHNTSNGNHLHVSPQHTSTGIDIPKKPIEKRNSAICL